MSKIRISIGEGLEWVMGKLQDAALDLIPDEGQLEILTQRMREDVDKKRGEYHAALSAVVEIENPNHPNEGRLPALRAKLARREEQGARAGQEFAATTSTKRKGELKAIMAQASQDITTAEREVTTQESLLATRKETLALRKEAYETARADLKKLEQVAPTILEQTRALEDAEKDRLRAVAASGKSSTSQAGALVAQLEQELETARAGKVASEIMLDEEQDETVDLDALEAEEQEEDEADERIKRWTSPSA